MKNIFVISLDEAVRTLNTRKEKFAIINVFKDSSDCGKPEIMIHKSSRRESGCVDIADIKMDTEGYDIRIWQADAIIRLCERCIDADDLYIVHDDRYNVAMNIADELAHRYCLALEYKNVPYNEYIHKMLNLKYAQISNSLLHKLKPMDYCKMILEVTFDQIRQSVCRETEEAAGLSEFFWYRQFQIILKSGLHIYYDLETNLENIYIPNMDDIEYVRFSGVPEIADPSSFEGNDKVFFNCDYVDYAQYGIYDYYDDPFTYNSENGLTYGDTHLPEKYKDYRTIQRDYWEFYKNGTKGSEYAKPEMERAYLGMKKAEEFLAERNGYTPKFCQLPRRFEEFGSFIYEEYAEHFKQYETMMRENNIWNGNEFETACLYASYFYMGSLLECGHCENMTILRCFFEHRYKDLEGLSEFEKFWNIDKYVPTTNDDPVNLLCLAAYALIETVRPYNGHRIPDDAFMKCLEKIYELTEGRTELNYAVILTGLFAGAYCQSLG